MMQSILEPRLKNMLVEASNALAHLDADRLEEMSLSCEALVRGAVQTGSNGKDHVPSKSNVQEMAIFARVLEATRANLNVMRRLRAIRTAQLEYGPSPANCGAAGENEHGDH